MLYRIINLPPDKVPTNMGVLLDDTRVTVFSETEYVPLATMPQRLWTVKVFSLKSRESIL